MFAKADAVWYIFADTRKIQALLRHYLEYHQNGEVQDVRQGPFIRPQRQLLEAPHQPHVAAEPAEDDGDQ
jgi:hypothetical protein